ncbi:helix-turn-helix and ligand-binding sensor domain-containing protein [Halpernia frigidisoli]|uniref:Y_Y_Y domain-containing protein n=1 Tax=Halpernia frigidisoli TaxID=1125876 RepID=A0A1I3FUA1_9FLAO|nr:triple tyrosine motif-containing protein [Halpernia frigidisoli]SFI14806.1 Y_Y_Y domain-containing protein [Halpernia frigidisoli]
MKKLILLSIIFLSTFVHAQSIEVKGVPLIENFVPAQYKNAGKIWDINSAKNGILYFAADLGLLEFDGKKWQLFKGSKGFTRSLLVENDSTIYTGSDVDFGIWKKDKFNRFNYRSLYSKKNKSANEYEEFWGVYKSSDQIIFASHENIYIQKNSKLSLIKAPSKFYASFEDAGKIYFADENKGLFLLDNDKLRLLFAYPENKNLQIVGVSTIENKLIVVTRSDGLFTFANNKLTEVHNSLSDKLKIEKIFSFKKINNSLLTFGTIINGLYITDLQDDILHHIDKKKGLANNTILNLECDNVGSLWCAMDFGLSKINLQNNLSYFFDNTGNFGSATSAVIWQNKFYLGTNQGLYISDWKNLDDSQPLNQFKLIPGSEGQVWSLQNIKGDLLIGHDQGLFQISGEKFEKIDAHHGVWTMNFLKDNYLLTGNYNGISVFKKINNIWQFQKKLNGIGGSCNQIVLQNDNKLWVNVPNYGIIKTDLDDHLNTSNIKTFVTEDFEGNNFNLYQKNNKIHVQTNLKDYVFDDKTNKFNSSYIQQNLNNENQLLNPFKIPVSISKDYLFHCIDNGFALEKVYAKKTDEYFNPTLFRSLEIFNNSERKSISLDTKIDYDFNNVRLNFIVPQTENAVFQYRFGGDKKWSFWTANDQFVFLNLKEGKYDFYVRAKIKNHINDVVKISFIIAAPFYRSWYAYLFYLLLAILAFILYRKREERLLANQKKVLLARQQKKLEKQSEKFQQEKAFNEQIQLEKEKFQLQQQVKDKTIELAIKAKEDDDKTRMLVIIKEKLEDAQSNPSQNGIRQKEIKRLLESSLKAEDHTFEIQMDELHQNFFKQLQNAHPVLSIYDLRLCAYLKTGLNTQEISEILGVLPSSLYVKRSRLHKKLDLGPDDDLYVFLNNF